MKSVRINGKEIGNGNPCYIISEIGNNHGVNIDTAKALIKASYEAGVDAVKFQTFKALDIVNPKVPANAYKGWDVSDKFEYWYQFVQTLEMPYEWYDELIAYARSMGLDFISTPASIEAALFLSEKKIDALKIASMDLNNIPFLEVVDKIGLPIILSTGMSTMDEIQESVAVFKKSPLILLHCVSNYPLKYGDANLLNIRMLKDYFKIPVGFSNHAIGYDLDITAVGIGASVIEKHFTLNRSNPDIAEHHFSMEPGEMRNMVEKIRTIEKAMGGYSRILSEDELRNRMLSRRSLTVIRDMRTGEIIRTEDITIIRPGTGIEPKYLKDIIGKRVKKEMKAFEAVKWEHLD